MKKTPLILLLIASVLTLQAQSRKKSSSNSLKKKTEHTGFIGKYELDGMTIQFAEIENNFVLIVPGAPYQKLKALGNNVFESTDFAGQRFTFVESDGKITGVSTDTPYGKSQGKKISSMINVTSIKMDSILVLTKDTEHFTFRYTAIDSVSVDSIATEMERNRGRILKDFKLTSIPKTTVRIYPDLASFHHGINLSGGPDNVLATAFGRDDIRMVSPNNAGPESWMLSHMNPHEFTHVVHLNLDYSPNNPRWLWEGVAQYEAGWFFDPSELEFIHKKEYPAFQDLNNGMEYMLGFAIIEAIKDLWTFDVVLQLIKAHGDVNKVLGMDQKQFEQKIFDRIYTKYVQK